MRRNSLIGLAASLALAAGASSALAQVGTAFTYQGQLKNSGSAVGTPTDLQFSLWNAPTAGTQVGSTITQTNVAVTSGLFTSSLDFGVNPYTGGQALYLQIAVRNPAGSGSYVTMGTRQRLTAAPFSLATRGIIVDSAGGLTIGSAASAGLLGFARGVDGGTTGFLGWLTPTDNTTFRLANFSGGGILRLESNAATVFTRSTDGAELARITSAGNFGIGINAPGSTLDVVGNGPIVPGSSAARAIRAQSLQPWGSCIGIDSSNLTGGKRWDLFASGGVAGEGQGKFIIRNDTDSVSAVVVTPTGTMGIGPGILTPLNILDVRRPNGATGDVVSFGSLTYAMGRLGEENSPANIVTISNIYPTNPANTSIDFRVGGSAVANTKARVRGDGVFEVKTLQINGGSDLVEGFDSQAANVEPGTLMVIDPEHPGQLMPSTASYDSKVAGVVSGAGGVTPGIHMGQDGVLDGKTPIAMTGRVYVRCTAAGGAMKPGDLLTTSDLAGCAMKAGDRTRAPGAAIGKAMSSLDEGSGLVLVLVNLQ